MQKQQTNWPTARVQIEKKLAQYKNCPGALAEKAGINYFAARRFVRNGVHNRGKNVDKLCELFGIEAGETAKLQNKTIDALSELLRNVWDGTEAHAQLIGKLIESTRSFRIEGRSKKPSQKR